MSGLKPPGYDGCAAWIEKGGGQKMIELSRVEAWDEEWLSLVAEARKMGLSVEEVRSFLLTATKENSE